MIRKFIAAFKHLANSIDDYLHINKVLAAQTSCRFDIIFQPMRNQAHRIEPVCSGGTFERMDVPLELDKIRATIIFFALVNTVDDRINLVELLCARIDELAFKPLLGILNVNFRYNENSMMI